MFEGSSFARSVDILKRSMDVSLLRRDVIANNIANAGVPNFKRSFVNFEAGLRRALESENYKPAFELSTTHPGHLPSYRPVDYRSIEPRRVLDYLTTEENNGNNVNAEQELMDSMENQLSYTMMAQAASYEFNQANLVLR